MIVQWFFLVSVLSGTFNPALEKGWPDVERQRHTYAGLAECESEREATHRYYLKHPVPGGAVVITGCQPWHVPETR